MILRRLKRGGVYEVLAIEEIRAVIFRTGQNGSIGQHEDLEIVRVIVQSADEDQRSVSIGIDEFAIIQYTETANSLDSDRLT